MIFILALIAFASATSVLLGENKLRHLSPVSNLDVLGHSLHEPVTINFAVPFESHLSNLERRWYVQSDPNAHNMLSLIDLPFKGDSSALYKYLTTNNTLEVPRDNLQFKVVLQPHEQRPVKVNGQEFDDMNTADGIAYRQIETREGTAWRQVGWARFVLHNVTTETSSPMLKLQGAFQVDDQSGLGFPSTVYHLTTVENLHSGLDEEDISRHLGKRALLDDYVVWRDFDARELTKDTPLANLNNYGLNDYTFIEGMSNGHLFRREGATDDTTSGFSSGVNLYSSIGNTTGCPSKRQVALVGLLADCNYVADFNTSSSIRQHLLDTVNQASQLYESAFNITLGLTDIILADDSTCSDNGTSEQPWNYACSSDGNALSDRLNRLTDWRASRNDHSLATWTLMTKCDAGSVVGLSWLGMVCQGSSSVAGGTNVVSRTSLDYLVLAHEIGHSFGAVHDCTQDTCDQNLDKTSECCPRGANQCVGSDQQVFVMNPASVEGIRAFSACSQGNICGGIKARSVNTTCLEANTGGLKLYSDNTCGNGIVEEGEECDCGGEDGCGPNSCCDPNTCKFRSGAVCDDANDECCHNCQYASTDVICRASTGPCDYTEYCTGESTECPKDEFAEDGTSCSLGSGNGTSLTCMSGHCSSRDLQCRTLMVGYTANGESLDGVSACDDDSTCTLSCKSKSYGGNVCFSTNHYFMDGTPCGGSGKCSNGRCIGASSTHNFWNNNGGEGGFPWRWVVIAVGVFVGVMIVGFIFGIFRRMSGRASGPTQSRKPPAIPPPGQAYAPAANNPVPGYYDQNFSPVHPNTYYYSDLQHPPPQAYGASNAPPYNR